MIQESIPSTYQLTNNSKLSFIDSSLCLLHNSNSLTAVKQALEGEVIPDRFKSLYDLIWSNDGKFDASMMPEWLVADYETNPHLLRDIIEVLEYHFTLATYTTEDEIDDFKQCLEDAIGEENAGSVQLIQAISKDLFLPPKLSLDERRKDINEKLEKVIEGYKGKSMFALKFFLLKLSGRKYLTHQDEDSSDSIQSLVTCFDQDYLKRLHDRQWAKLEYGYRKQETLGVAGNTFERFDLINQAALGVLDLKFAYRSSTKLISALLNLTTNMGASCHWQQRLHLTNSFSIDSSVLAKAQKTVRMQFTSVSDIMDAVIRDEPLAVSNMVKADFDYIGVYYDHDSHLFRYVLQDESLDIRVIHENSNFFCVFNSQDKAIADIGSFRVLFSYNPDSLAFPESKKYELFWKSATNEPTLGELANYLAKCRYGNDSMAGELIKKLMFSTKRMHFQKHGDQADSLIVNTKDYDESTALKKIVADLGRPENIERVIDLFCFEEKDGNLGQSFDFLRTTSEKYLNMKPKLQSLLNYLFALESEVFKQSQLSDSSQQPNHFKNRDLSFYLPNLLFVTVTKVNCGFQLLDDCNLDYLRRQITGDLHLSTGFKVIGGIYSEGSFNRPFVVKDGKVSIVLADGQLQESNIVMKRPEDIMVIALERITAEIAD